MLVNICKYIIHGPSGVYFILCLTIIWWLATVTQHLSTLDAQPLVARCRSLDMTAAMAQATRGLGRLGLASPWFWRWDTCEVLAALALPPDVTMFFSPIRKKRLRIECYPTFRRPPDAELCRKLRNLFCWAKTVWVVSVYLMRKIPSLGTCSNLILFFRTG